MRWAILFLVPGLVWFTCKKSSDPSGLGPTELGKKIGTDHQKMMAELAGILKDRSSPETLRPKLETLKEKYIKLHVASGKRRQTFNPKQREECDSELRNLLFNVSRAHFKVLQDASGEFRKTDRELANEISSFNTLTQYANFELLKKQQPQEAQRLGIQ